MQSKNYYFNAIFKKLNWDIKYYDILLYTANNVLYNSEIKNNKVWLFDQRVIKNVVIKLIICFLTIFKIKFNKNKSIIISNSYVKLENSNYIFAKPPWLNTIEPNTTQGLELKKTIKKLKKIIDQRKLRELFSNQFQEGLLTYEHEFSNFLDQNKIKALIVPNDMSFFENYSISIARQKKIKTFVYLHGMPARYNSIDDNRADFLLVWGKGIKEEYVKNGVQRSKVISLKHPFYSDWKDITLRSDFNDVLVITKSVAETPSSSNKVVLGVKSNTLLYAELVKDILAKLGIKKARLRLHPSESNIYYLNSFIDDFYEIDYLTKFESLNQATLVIGPSSTMVLDAIKSGVNYILFDPKIDGLLIDNQETLYPPFDGSSFIKLSKDTEDFKRNIEHPEENIDFDKLSDFFSVEHEDLNFLNTLLDN